MNPLLPRDLVDTYKKSIHGPQCPASRFEEIVRIVNSSKDLIFKLKDRCPQRPFTLNVDAPTYAYHATCTSTTVTYLTTRAYSTVKQIHSLAGEMPLDIVVVSHALNEQLIVQMLGEINRLEALHNPLSDRLLAGSQREELTQPMHLSVKVPWMVLP